MELSILFRHPDGESGDPRDRFVTAFNARPDVQRARGALVEAERRLLQDAGHATKALEAAIKTVAQKFEKPPKY